MTVNESDIWFVAVPSLVLLVCLWVMELRRLLVDPTALNIVFCLAMAVAWTVLLFIVVMVVAVFFEGIYCEDCSTRPASGVQLVVEPIYLAIAALLCWRVIDRIRTGARKRPALVLSAEQEAIGASLSPELVARIDEALVSRAGMRGRKVAMIVGLVMADRDLYVPGLPDLYYAGRVKELVMKGRLVAEGNLDHMERSKVRLP